MRLSPAAPQRPESGALRRAVFIDKAGTVVDDLPYNVTPGLPRFTPNALAALRCLSDAGYLLIVVRNRPGLALRHFSLTSQRKLAAAIDTRLREAGVRLNGFYVCPHAPGAACKCRKPAPGMLLEAARHHGIDLDRSWIIGDVLDDVEAGWRAGCGTVLLDVGNETAWHWAPIRIPTFRVGDLEQAAAAIVDGPVARVPRRRPTVRRPSRLRERGSA